MTAPEASLGGYRLLEVSIRGHGILTGGPLVEPIDAVPPHVGTRFHSISEIVRYVRRELRGNSSIWQVRIIGGTGTVLLLGFRSRPNGTGGTWTWRPPQPTTPIPAEASQ